MKKVAFLFSAFFLLTCFADIRLAWDPSPSSDNVIGYRIYYSRTTNDVFSLDNTNVILGATIEGYLNTNATITNLYMSNYVRFAATAYSANEESELSNVITNKWPSKPLLLKVINIKTL